MATALWGKVFYKEHFAGYLREEPGDRFSFTYDENYLNSKQPPIAHTLVLQSQPHISIRSLHPFFDNLVAEGWMENAQTRLLGKRQATRFELLLAFGHDCAGAVSVIDPEQFSLSKDLLDVDDVKTMAVMTSRSSLSGVQPKLTLVQDNDFFRPSGPTELSTYIAKFPSNNHNDLVINEYLTTLAFQSLLPEDDVAEVKMDEIKGFSEQALIIKRFDRKDGARIHFEEFNQLLNYKSSNKYDGDYKLMADFIRETKGCLPAEAYRLYLRILAGLLLGNTDMHFKNFAMFHTEEGLRLTPSYDQVAAAIYQYKTIALAIFGARDIKIGGLKPTSLIRMGHDFGLNNASINMAVKQLEKNIEAAKQIISEAKIGDSILKQQIIDMLGKRWNGTFSLIGQYLSKKRYEDVNNKD